MGRLFEPKLLSSIIFNANDNLLFLFLFIIIIFMQQHPYSCFRYYQLIKYQNHDLVLIGSKTSQSDYYALYIKYINKTQNYETLQDVIVELGPFDDYKKAKQTICKYTKLQKQISKSYIRSIIGFQSLLQGYYMIYVTHAEERAVIGVHKIYQVIDVQIVPLFQLRDQYKEDQIKHFELLKQNVFRQFYFSYTYDLTNCLSYNMNSLQTDISYQIEDSFRWNFTQVKVIESLCNKGWQIIFIHGYIRQIPKIIYQKRNFRFILIARRSRHHSGARYIKRGINSEGYSANQVQTEQIMVENDLEKMNCTSYVQIRGSCPVYWFQEPSIFIIQPSIEIINNDLQFQATRKHFQRMVERHGSNIFCVNLMKKQESAPRELLLTQQYRKALAYINDNDKLHYMEVDLKELLKSQDTFGLNIGMLSYYLILNTGFYSFDSTKDNIELYIQNGIIRTNCVDCLDRTNSFQELVSEIAVQLQLKILSNESIDFEQINFQEKTLKSFEAIYQQLGDTISLQYGSSIAHPNKPESSIQIKRIKTLTQIQRHWNNNINDYERQQRLDIYLNHFPKNRPFIYDLKPQIIFEPNQQVVKKKQNWFNQSYSNFKSKMKIQELRLLSLKKQGKYFNQARLSQIQNSTVLMRIRKIIKNILIKQKQSQFLFFQLAHQDFLYNAPTLRLSRRQSSSKKSEARESIKQKVLKLKQSQESEKTIDPEQQLKLKNQIYNHLNSNQNLTLEQLTLIEEFIRSSIKNNQNN